jgi:rubrerythrin
MNDIDALTLRLLTSKKRYNTYLATANPDKSAEIQEYYDKVSKNKRRMKEIIGKYLDNPETETNNEVDDMFETFFKTLLKHFDMKDYEDKCAKHGYDATDSSEEEESLFAKDREEEEQEEEEQEEEEQEDSKPPLNTSFWGKKINKRSNTLDQFIIRK